MPWCELHLHIEGTLEPATIFALASAQGTTLPYRDEADLADRYRFHNLQSFLDLYYKNMIVLRAENDFYRLATAYLTRAHRGGVRHAEMFVDPQAHAQRGVSAGAVLRGIHRAVVEAEERLGMSGGIIACVLRDHPVADAERMLDDVLATDVPLLGLGLDSREVGYPPVLFRSVFARAATAGLHRVAHAGEEGPPEYVWQALDELGAERIDHGIRSLEDPALVARLIADRIPLTVCPLSNVRLRVVPNVGAVPLRHMLDGGLVVTINSDDPAYFGGYLDDNLDAITTAFNLTAADHITLARNAVDASFAPAPRKQQMLEHIGNPAGR
ncbi:MAG: adenosine deaminase [Candidatus Lumbricidophila eiseniae]|uniref:Adenine deaminase n=1 Tax=Candidatus Lumbricidiphila eiseniae TaxID=1969409 RepID=A0A2A6FUC3_9MICO|nr:MAG: adenosine deaminase [Candidatus Lumbricidophila eiseniae]